MSAALGILSSILLARFLGAAGLGVLAYATAWIGLLSTVATLGFNQLLTREIAIYSSRGEWAALRGLMILSRNWGVCASVLLAVSGCAAAYFLTGDDVNSEFRQIFFIAAAGIPLVTLVQFRQAAMRGFKRVALGLVPENAAFPLLFIALLTAGYYALDRQLTPIQVAAIQLTSLCMAFTIGLYLLKKILPDQVTAATPTYHRRLWMRMAVPLFLIATVQFLNHRVDTLMLGYLAPAEQVGYYTVARNITEAIIFILVATEMTIAPNIAQLYARGDIVRLQEIVRRAAQFVAVVSIPLTILVMLFGPWLLMLYGDDFIAGVLALQLLCMGQLFNALCGPTGQLAIHTGHDKAATAFVAIAALANIFFNWLLIPLYGAAGAAAATAIGISIWNIGLLVYITARTGLSALAIPLPIKIQTR